MGTTWRYIDGTGQPTGPVTPQELQELCAQGRLPRDAAVRCEGMAEWVPAWSVPQFASAAPPARPPALPVAPSLDYFRQAPEARTRRRTERHCIAIFVLCLLALLAATCGLLGSMVFGSWLPILLLPWLIPFGAFTAASFFRARWREVQALGGGPATYGVIGAIGLGVQLLLFVIAWVRVAL